MNFDNYTIKSQEVLNKAKEIATTHGQQVIETSHLLLALLQSDENLVSYLFKKIGSNRSVIEQKLDEKYSEISFSDWRPNLFIQSSITSIEKFGGFFE